MSKGSIQRILQDVGISPHLRGFYYLEAAVREVYEDRELLWRLTSDLYPMVANKFRVTPAAVNRDIRNAIECAWDSIDTQVIKEVFGANALYRKDRPKNSQFIASVVLYLKRQKGEQE